MKHDDAHVTVRPACPDDVPALVRLRLANAERHVALAPEVYRLPERKTVREHFAELLAAGSQTSEEPRKVLISVAETGGEVVGMTELVLLSDPPDHQILIPRRAAEIHTVVLDGHRGNGVGATLVAATESLAAELGIEILYAGIFTANEPAVRFYGGAGFGPRGTLLSKELRRDTPVTG